MRNGIVKMIRTRRLFAVVLVVLAIASPLWAQPAGDASNPASGRPSYNPFGGRSILGDQGVESRDSSTPSAEAGLNVQDGDRVRRAMSDPRYPATPGDVYRLSFAQATDTVNMNLTVNSDYSVDMDFLGSIDVEGMRYTEVRSQIRSTVRNAYPGASVRLTIAATGEFPVFVTGEVTTAQEVYTWGLARLSTLSQEFCTDFTSVRKVTIRNADGTEKTIDLFAARRFGERANDPFLRPGQTIVFPRAERRVEITGSVYRPGTYDLLPGEGYEELLRFAGGYLDTADRGAIQRSRFLENHNGRGRPMEARYYPHSELLAGQLRNLDRIHVSDQLRAEAYLFLDGAVRPPGASGESTAGTSFQRTPITPGERLSSYVQDIEELFLDSAELGSAYLRRDSELIPVDILALLQGKHALSADPELRSGDVLVVPLQNLEVIVRGAVKNPGIYEYVPQRTWRYYVNRAGGFNDEANSFENIVVMNGDREEIDPDSTVRPGYTILARRDSPRFWFFRGINSATTTLNFTTSVLRLLETLGAAEPSTWLD